MRTVGATKGSVRTFCPDLRAGGADLTSPAAMVADMADFPVCCDTFPLSRGTDMPRDLRSSGAFGSLLLRVTGLLHRPLSRRLRGLERLFQLHLTGQGRRHGLAGLRADRLELRNSDELNADIGFGVLRRGHRIGGFDRLLFELW